MLQSRERRRRVLAHQGLGIVERAREHVDDDVRQCSLS